MTAATKRIVLAALSPCYRSDDAIRARNAFRGLTPAQMTEEYGQSGKTRRQILEEYEAHERAVDAAIDEVNRD
jgi:hypothetical protein